MENSRIGTLQLSGTDALNFVHSFFFPSADEIREHENLRERRNENISTLETENGFVASVEDLDLSFLDDEIESEKIEKNEQMQVMITVSVDMRLNGFVNHSTESSVAFPVHLPRENSDFILCNTDTRIATAA